VHTADIGASTATDADLLEAARQENRIVVTLDADFHALLALAGSSSPSVIRIRIEGLDGGALAALLLATLDECGEDLERGAMVTVQRHRLRVRRLPLLR
jgi:predicted nuclease of predicted toxin-antitoxin system